MQKQQQQKEQQEREDAVGRLWKDVIMREITEAQAGEFKSHSELPFARIKKIVAADEDVRMVSSEVPVVLARACRMFIMELTLRAFQESSQGSRKTIQKEDVHGAVAKMEPFYFFLKDVFDGTIEQERKSLRASSSEAMITTTTGKGDEAEAGAAGTGATVQDFKREGKRRSITQGS